MKKLTVKYEQDKAGLWVADIPAVAGCHTQGRTIEQARERIREALAALVGDREAARAELVDDVELPAQVRRLVNVARKRRAEAETTEQIARGATVQAARALAKAGLSLRDVGALLGVTRQRAHQLLSA